MYSESISKGDRVVTKTFDATGAVMGILREDGRIVIDADDGFIDLAAQGDWLRVPTPQESAADLRASKKHNRAVTANMLRSAVKRCFEAIGESIESHKAVNADAADQHSEMLAIYNGRL